MQQVSMGAALKNDLWVTDLEEVPNNMALFILQTCLDKIQIIMEVK